MKNYSPLRYPGGKTQLYQYVKELVKINEATTYIEPFMGGMGIAINLLINNEVEKIMVNDYDKAIYAFWYSVLHYPEELIALIKTTPITIEEWQNIKLNITKTKNSLTFFDPPYFVKGSSLYPSFYKKENHIDLSNAIKKYLKNKKWILTYDVVPEIYELYNEFRNKKYYLNYSISKPNQGIEYMFYSNKIIISDETENLKEALINDK